MKKMITRTTTAIVLAITMLLAVIGGLLFIKNEGKMADAADAQPTVTISADTNSFVAGGKFKLTVTVNAPGLEVATIGLYIGPAATAMTFDTEKMALLTMTNYSLNPIFVAGTNCRDQSNAPAANLQSTRGMYAINLANITGVSSENLVVFTADFEIASTAAAGTEFKFDVVHHTTNSVALKEVGANKAQYTYAGGNNAKVFNIQPLEFAIKEPSNNAKLSEIKVGQGEESATNVYQTLDTKTDGTNLDDTFSIVVNDPTAPLTVIPTSVEGVKSITLKPGDVVVTDGKGDVTIPSNGVVTIEVVAEDGITKETYTINVKVVGASLTALIAASDSTLAGVTKKDLQGTFSSGTLEYEVIVPDDGEGVVTVTPTISTGNYANTTAALEKEGAATLSATSVQSGSPFTVSNIETGNTVKIKVSADDGAGNTSEKIYTLTFKVVKTATDFTMVVKGRVNTTNVFQNSATKAAAENPVVDYYYAIVGETSGRCTVVITPPDSAEVTVNGNTYAAPGIDLAEGTHTITVTAEAGNSVTKKVKIVNYVPLELKPGVVADFMFEEAVDYGITSYYRRTYKEKNLVHGVDDLDFERLVIGQIAPKTSVNDFLELFTDKTKIRLYDFDGLCFWDCGSLGSAIDDDTFFEEDLDDWRMLSVGSGYYIEYVVNGKVEEKIYLSVLGDLNGDGYVQASDIAWIGEYLRGEKTLADFDVEVRLAAYLTQAGDMVIADIGIIGEVLLGVSDVVDLFYQS